VNPTLELVPGIVDKHTKHLNIAFALREHGAGSGGQLFVGPTLIARNTYRQIGPSMDWASLNTDDSARLLAATNELIHELSDADSPREVDPLSGANSAVTNLTAKLGALALGTKYRGELALAPSGEDYSDLTVPYSCGAKVSISPRSGSVPIHFHGSLSFGTDKYQNVIPNELLGTYHEPAIRTELIADLVSTGAHGPGFNRLFGKLLAVRNEIEAEAAGLVMRRAWTGGDSHMYALAMAWTIYFDSVWATALNSTLQISSELTPNVSQIVVRGWDDVSRFMPDGNANLLWLGLATPEELSFWSYALGRGAGSGAKVQVHGKTYHSNWARALPDGRLLWGLGLARSCGYAAHVVLDPEQVLAYIWRYTRMNGATSQCSAAAIAAFHLGVAAAAGLEVALPPPRHLADLTLGGGVSAGRDEWDPLLSAAAPIHMVHLASELTADLRGSLLGWQTKLRERTNMSVPSNIAAMSLARALRALGSLSFKLLGEVVGAEADMLAACYGSITTPDSWAAFLGNTDRIMDRGAPSRLSMLGSSGRNSLVRAAANGHQVSALVSGLNTLEVDSMTLAILNFFKIKHAIDGQSTSPVHLAQEDWDCDLHWPSGPVTVAALATDIADMVDLAAAEEWNIKLDVEFVTVGTGHPSLPPVKLVATREDLNRKFTSHTATQFTWARGLLQGMVKATALDSVLAKLSMVTKPNSPRSSSSADNPPEVGPRRTLPGSNVPHPQQQQPDANVPDPSSTLQEGEREEAPDSPSGVAQLDHTSVPLPIMERSGQSVSGALEVDAQDETGQVPPADEVEDACGSAPSHAYLEPWFAKGYVLADCGGNGDCGTRAIALAVRDHGVHTTSDQLLAALGLTPSDVDPAKGLTVGQLMKVSRSLGVGLRLIRRNQATIIAGHGNKKISIVLENGHYMALVKMGSTYNDHDSGGYSARHTPSGRLAQHRTTSGPQHDGAAGDWLRQRGFCKESSYAAVNKIPCRPWKDGETADILGCAGPPGMNPAVGGKRPPFPTHRYPLLKGPGFAVLLVTPQQLWNSVSKKLIGEWPLTAAAIADQAGPTYQAQTVAALLAYLSAYSHKAELRMLLDRAISRAWNDNYPLRAKEFDLKMRETGYVDQYKLACDEKASIAYLHSLSAKAVGDADWVAEARERSTVRAEFVDTWRSSAGKQGLSSSQAMADYDAILNVSGVRASSDFIETKLTAETVKDYASRLLRENTNSRFSQIEPELDTWWARRCEWGVAGALHCASETRGDSVLETLSSCPLNGKKSRVDKQVALAAASDSELDQILNEQPGIYAKPHTKRNELGGKLRAIYGVNFEHYVICSAVSGAIETITAGGPLFKPCSSGGKMEVFLTALNKSKQEGAWLSFDYSDFNMAHRHDYQAAVYEAYDELFASGVAQYAGSRLQRAVRWLRAACQNQYVWWPPVVGNEPGYTRVYQGLFSGVRDTTLLNTILNATYAKFVGASAARHGVPMTIEAGYYYGDDVLLRLQSDYQAVAWIAFALHVGLRANPQKCLVDTGTGEFLRVQVGSSLNGSLARSVANLINGNWESVRARSPVERLAELLASYWVLKRRGALTEWAATLTGMAAEQWCFHQDGVTAKQLEDSLAPMRGEARLAHELWTAWHLRSRKANQGEATTRRSRPVGTRPPPEVQSGTDLQAPSSRTAGPLSTAKALHRQLLAKGLVGHEALGKLERMYYRRAMEDPMRQRCDTDADKATDVQAGPTGKYTLLDTGTHMPPIGLRGSNASELMRWASVAQTVTDPHDVGKQLLIVVTMTACSEGEAAHALKLNRPEEAIKGRRGIGCVWETAEVAGCISRHNAAIIGGKYEWGSGPTTSSQHLRMLI